MPSNLITSIGIGALGLVALVLNWLPQLDEAAEVYLSGAISENLVIYATARTLNAVISVIQSIHFSVSFGPGVGLNLGEALDPLNDLIERFSTLVLYGLAGLGIQKLVLVATSSTIMKIVTSAGLVVGYLVWFLQRNIESPLTKICLVLVLVRFCFVIEVGAIVAMDKLYFDDQTRHAHTALQLAQEKLSSLREQYMDSSARDGILSGLWETTVAVTGNDSQEGMTDLTARAITELIVIMLVRGLLFPILFVWGYLQLMRWMVSSTGHTVSEHR